VRGGKAWLADVRLFRTNTQENWTGGASCRVSEGRHQGTNDLCSRAGCGPPRRGLWLGYRRGKKGRPRTILRAAHSKKAAGPGDVANSDRTARARLSRPGRRGLCVGFCGAGLEDGRSPIGLRRLFRAGQRREFEYFFAIGARQGATRYGIQDFMHVRHRNWNFSRVAGPKNSGRNGCSRFGPAECCETRCIREESDSAGASAVRIRGAWKRIRCRFGRGRGRDWGTFLPPANLIVQEKRNE